MKGPRNLGDLQLAILRALWNRGEAPVSEVHGALSDRGLALTTIATMLRKMEEKGLVGHRTEGRTFIYRAIVSEQEVSKSMTHDLLDRLFEGSVASLLSHLLSTREVSAGEVKELEQLLKERKARK